MKPKLLSREEEHRLAELHHRTGDCAAAHALILSNMGFVHQCAWRRRGYHVDHEDLVQEGCLGLMKAVKRYEQRRGLRLITYAVHWINAYMDRYVMEHAAVVRFWTTQQRRRLFHKIRNEREKADKIAGGRASDETLAKTFGVRAKDVAETEAFFASCDVSLDDSYEEGMPSYVSLLREEGPDPEQAFLDKERNQQARDAAVKACEHMSDRHKTVLARRILSTDPRSLQELGDGFRVSRERVRQIEMALMRKIRERMGR